MIVKQLLNFVEKECILYDYTTIKNSILALYGNDESRLISLRLMVEKDGKKELLKFFADKQQKDAIKKRFSFALARYLTNQRDDDTYEIEKSGGNSEGPFRVGCFKFHSQNNTRVICREYRSANIVTVVMIEHYKKKTMGNEGKYLNRLDSAAKRKHYFIHEDKSKEWL